MAQTTSTSTTTPVRPPAPRRTTSRFVEAAMNSRSSIHPPPDMLWQDLGMETLLDKFSEEANAPARSRPDSGIGSLSSTSSVAPASTTSSATEGTFGRFSRALSSFFHGSGFSNLGKRKAGAESATTPAPPADDRREQARMAYEHAKEMGLLPTPKVFVRPQARPRRKSAGPGSPQTPLPSVSVPSTPLLETPQRTIYKSASKKDLNKQKKLSKRVSNLEHKLSEARKELGLALALKQKEAVAASKLHPPISPVRPLTPNNTHFLISPESEANSTVLIESTSSNHANKITKKRKATSEKAVNIYGDSDAESEPSAKKSKKVVTPRRQSTRLRKSRSTTSIQTISKEEVVTVVPGGSVPPMPVIPGDVEGNRVVVGDDGFGGLSHEIF